jgi:hypothetical protein
LTTSSRSCWSGAAAPPAPPHPGLHADDGGAGALASVCGGAGEGRGHPLGAEPRRRRSLLQSTSLPPTSSPAWPPSRPALVPRLSGGAGIPTCTWPMRRTTSPQSGRWGLLHGWVGMGGSGGGLHGAAAQALMAMQLCGAVQRCLISKQRRPSPLPTAAACRLRSDAACTLLLPSPAERPGRCCWMSCLRRLGRRLRRRLRLQSARGCRWGPRTQWQPAATRPIVPCWRQQVYPIHTTCICHANSGGAHVCA